MPYRVMAMKFKFVKKYSQSFVYLLAEERCKKLQHYYLLSLNTQISQKPFKYDELTF
jgi:hypothetical protein